MGVTERRPQNRWRKGGVHDDGRFWVDFASILDVNRPQNRTVTRGKPDLKPDTLNSPIAFCMPPAGHIYVSEKLSVGGAGGGRHRARIVPVAVCTRCFRSVYLIMITH